MRAVGLLTNLLTSGSTSTVEDTGDGREVDAHAEQTLAEATWPASSDPPWTGAGSITRDQAVRVPTIARARNVVCGTVGLLPLATWDAALEDRQPGRRWVRQPERDLPRSHTLTWTADDLWFHGIGCWRVTREYREDRRPRLYERIAPGRLEYRSERGRGAGRWYVDGQAAPRTGPGRLILFHGLEEGLLERARKTIRVALLLEAAAANYAAEPVPTSILKNTGGARISDTKVKELLDNWRTARRTKATAYVDALELEAVGIDPAGMQLVEARQHLALELARACNLDAHYVNASEPGTSMTYSNVTQERRKLVDFTLRHYLAPIEDRLSLDDVTAPALAVRFDLDDFLRGDAKTRAEVLETLVNIEDSDGNRVLTIDEARAREGLARSGG